MYTTAATWTIMLTTSVTVPRKSGMSIGFHPRLVGLSGGFDALDVKRSTPPARVDPMVGGFRARGEAGRTVVTVPGEHVPPGVVHLGIKRVVEEITELLSGE